MTDRAPTPAEVEAIAEVLAAHKIAAFGPGEYACKCSPTLWRPSAHHASHVAEQIARLAARERANALRDLTTEEAEALDWSMSEHMYRHSISNNIAGMSCHAGCRTDALALAVNRVLRDRVDRQELT